VASDLTSYELRVRHVGQAVRFGSPLLRKLWDENTRTPWASPPPRFSGCELSAVSYQPHFISSECRDSTWATVLFPLWPLY